MLKAIRQLTHPIFYWTNWSHILKKIKFPKPDQIGRYIFNLPLIQDLIKWSKEHSLPGFFHVPIYDVIIFVFNEVRRFDLFTRANSMAFSFFLALFPSLIHLLFLPFYSPPLLPFTSLPFFLFLLPPMSLQSDIHQFHPSTCAFFLIKTWHSNIMYTSPSFSYVRNK